MRIAQLDGLHTQLPEEHLGAQTVARCQDLWWSLYILDRQISFSLGLPMTTQDAEITTSIKAPENFPQDPIFSLQVKLSQMQTFILGGTCYWLLYFCNYSQSTESNIQDGEDPARTVSGNHKKYTPKHGWPSRRDREDISGRLPWFDGYCTARDTPYHLVVSPGALLKLCAL